MTVGRAILVELETVSRESEDTQTDRTSEHRYWKS